MVKTREKSVSKKQPEEFDFKIMQANFSSLLYVLTEQQAIIGKLLQELLEGGTINAHQLEKITNIYGDGKVLGPVYQDLYKRFAWYFLRTKEALEKAPDVEKTLSVLSPFYIIDHQEEKNDE